MKKIEITFKVAFVVLALALIITGSVNYIGFLIFLLISFVLGGVLIINKDSSYSYKQTKRDYKIRKTEGVLLVIFAVLGWLWITGVIVM